MMFQAALGLPAASAGFADDGLGNGLDVEAGPKYTGQLTVGDP
jgi:hypothetical protein